MGEEEMTGSVSGSFLVTKVPSGSLYVALRKLEFISAEESIGEEEGDVGVGPTLVKKVPSGKRYVACLRLGLSKAEDNTEDEWGEPELGPAGSVFITNDPSGSRYVA